MVCIHRSRRIPHLTHTLATIAHLRARKQRYKLKMFTRLHYILLFTVVVIAIFFVVSSMSFSGRLAEGVFPSYNCRPFFLIPERRLRRQIMASEVVALGRMAGPPLLDRVCPDCFPVAS